MTRKDVQRINTKFEVIDELSRLIRGIEDGLNNALPEADFVNSLVDELVVEMVDSGIKPQFLEILPRFIGGLGIAILVTNLSERLDQCSNNAKCEEVLH